MTQPSEKIIEIVRRGGLIIFPTETIYGLGCDATNEDAVRRVFELKAREAGKPPPLLVSGEAQLGSLVAEVPPFASELMQRFWPGALTIVLRVKPHVSSLLTATNSAGDATIAVRHSAHATAQQLCERLGAPLVATSANLSGASGRAACPQTLDEVALVLRRRADAEIDGGAVGGLPSTIVDCSGATPKVLRQGAIELGF